MKILVTVKRVIDPYVKIRVRSDHRGVETEQVKHAINPFDEIAVEEAIRLLEQKIATEVVVVTIGSDATQEVLRHALALGATRGILVETDQSLCCLSIAQILCRVVQDEKPDLVLMGKQAIDDDSNQTPQMLAALLNWPQATYASTLSIEQSKLTVTREVDSGLEVLQMACPAIVSVDLRLNTPRYASLPNIMKAKQKSLTRIALDSLALNLKQHTERLSVVAPVAKREGIRVASVDELMVKLRDDAGVL
jgi:electron transfer flavoprotein beta subunit